jgi:hypothetical protein
MIGLSSDANRQEYTTTRHSRQGSVTVNSVKRDSDFDTQYLPRIGRCSDILSTVWMARELGIPSLFVETNCAWCRDETMTRDRLAQLKAAGLHGILISVNPFYTEHVPFARTEHCIQISYESLGRNVFIYQAEHYRRFRRMGVRGKLPLERYLEYTDSGLTGQVEMFLMGRAARQLRPFSPARPARAYFHEPCRPAFLRNWHNRFDNYGNLVAGYCGGISLGNWLEIERLVEDGIDAQAHPVLSILVTEDMEALLRFAIARGYQRREDGYVSKCDLCLDMRLYLVGQGNYAELSPVAFYKHL